MIPQPLQDEIRARVRLQARGRGIKHMRAGAIAQIYRGRAPKNFILDAVRAAIMEITTGGEVRNPAAPSLAKPQEMVRCHPNAMSLTRAGCARLWSSARESAPQPWEGRAACVSCREGAVNAGFAPSTVAGLVEEVARVCPRCMRSTSRLINGRFCVSCYNRDCEARRGKNARGGRPRICDQLGSRQMVKSTAAGHQIVSGHSLLGASELVIFHAAFAREATAFGWAPRGPGDHVDVA